MRRHDLIKKYLPTYIPTHLPTYLPMYLLKERSYRLVTFETLITILTIENLDSWQSLLSDNQLWHWTAFAILAMFCFCNCPPGKDWIKDLLTQAKWQSHKIPKPQVRSYFFRSFYQFYPRWQKIIISIPRDGYLGENVFFGQKEEAAQFQVEILLLPDKSKQSSIPTVKALVVLIKVEYKAAIEGVILGLVTTL